MSDRLVNEFHKLIRIRGNEAILVGEVHEKFNTLCNRCAFNANDYVLETVVGFTGRVEATFRHKATNETVLMEAMCPYHERICKCRLFEDDEVLAEIIP